MRFYIYHRPLHSIRKKEWMGTLIHVSLEEKTFSPDGEVWAARRCVRPESVYTRLVGMLRHGGWDNDEVHPLSNRKLTDLVTYMNQWEKSNG